MTPHLRMSAPVGYRSRAVVGFSILAKRDQSTQQLISDAFRAMGEATRATFDHASLFAAAGRQRVRGLRERLAAVPATRAPSPE